MKMIGREKMFISINKNILNNKSKGPKKKTKEPNYDR